MERGFTKHVASIELQDEPTVLLVGVRAEDGEDGALLARLCQQLVHVHLPLGELELCPRLSLIGAEPNKQSYKYESGQNTRFNLNNAKSWYSKVVLNCVPSRMAAPSQWLLWVV